MHERVGGRNGPFEGMQLIPMNTMPRTEQPTGLTNDDTHQLSLQCLQLRLPLKHLVLLVLLRVPHLMSEHKGGRVMSSQWVG